MQPASEQLPQIQAKMKADIEQLRKEAKRATMLIGLDFLNLYRSTKSKKPSNPMKPW